MDDTYSIINGSRGDINGLKNRVIEMTKKYSAGQIQSALRHESEVAETLARLSRANSYMQETEAQIEKLKRKLDGQTAARDDLKEGLAELDRIKDQNKELFDVFKSMNSPVQPKRTIKTTPSGRMAKISTEEKIMLIKRAMKQFIDNRDQHLWDDPDTVPLYFIKSFMEKVKETEIGNITIWMRKAIEQGGFKLSGKTRTRAIRIKS